MSIKLFTKGRFRNIIVKDSISGEEVEDFKFSFIPSIDKYEITFLNIRSLPRSIVEILYEIMYVKKLQAIIYVSSYKLSNYLRDINITHFPLKYADKNIRRELKEVSAVVLGGSADSLENILALARTIPLADISIFIVQHIKSDAPLLLDNIIKKHTSYKVIYPNNGEKIEKGVMYINPPDYHMRVTEGKIELDKGDKVNYARPSVSVLFESVSKMYENGAVAVMTCGYGKDGSEVLKQMRDNETTVIIHDPSECEAKDMPLNAIKTKDYDFTWSIDEIRGFFSALLQTIVNKDDAITMFLKQLHILYGYDFTKYDRGSVTRRINASMLKHEICSFQLFVKEVLTKREMFDDLVLSISINVTEFFRKPSLYIALKDLLEKKYSSALNIKIWVAGSSTGQEAYSISMLLHEMYMNKRSLIYATDFNSVVVNEASNGIFSNQKVNDYKKNADKVLRGDFYNYFDANKAYWTVKDEIRKKVLFFTHNLVTDTSFNQFDIISCKNVLIYFTPVLQERVLQLFYDSLNENGYLLLGESEKLHSAFEGRFVPYSNNNKIYKKVA